MAGLVDEAMEDLVTGIADGHYISKTTVVGFSVAALAVGAGVGFVAGYYFAERKLRVKYTRVAEAEIDTMREHFRRQAVAREKKPDLGELGTVIDAARYASSEPKPKTAEEVYAEVVEDQGMPRAVKPPVAVRNVFETINTEIDSDEGWDFDAEVLARSPDRPYVIHIGELAEHDHELIHLNYYEADDILCNDKNEIIADRELVVGEDNLEKFGHGSGDREIVYVRNVNLGTEIEITRSHGSYSEDVHGIKHSDEDHFSRRRRGRRYEEG